MGREWGYYLEWSRELLEREWDEVWRMKGLLLVDFVPRPSFPEEGLGEDAY